MALEGILYPYLVGCIHKSSVIWGFDWHGLKIEFESEMKIWYSGSCFTTQKWQRSQSVKNIYGVKIKKSVIIRNTEI